MPSLISRFSFLFALSLFVFMFSYHFQGAANEVYFDGFFIIMDGPCSTFETENICNYCDNTKKIKIGLRGRHFF